ncbi:MAG TPA: hypothetical protein VI160_05480 [Gemmatimonadales bacterium]
MRRILLLAGTLGFLAAGTAPAQTRGRIVFGFGGPAVRGYIVLGHPWYFSPYRRPLVLVRPYGPPRRIEVFRRPWRGGFFRRDLDRDDFRPHRWDRGWRGERRHRGW